MPQTSVSITPSVAFAGMVGDSELTKNARSYVSAEASAEIQFGIMVKQGTGDDQCLLPTATTDKFVGVTLHSHAYDKDTELGTLGLKPKVAVNALQQGTVWVVVDEAVSPADAVRVRVTSAGGAVGTFRKTAVGGQSVNISGFARWLSTTTGAGLALLQLDMSGRQSGTAD